MSKSYHADERGYYGDFGGSYVPEMLFPNMKELQENYLQIINDPGFVQEFNELLRDYVGRPSPLYLAKRLSDRYGEKI